MFPRIGALRRFRPSLWLVLLVVFLALEVLIHYYSLLVPKPATEQDEVFFRGCTDPSAYTTREKAVIVMLARNSELEGAMLTLRAVEQRFNRFFNYPVMFLNDEPWESDVMAALNASVSGNALFETIPADQWGFPPDIDVAAAEEAMAEQGRAGVKYGAEASYHHMCRFFSG